MQLQELAAAILDAAERKAGNTRFICAVAGAPGSGKSTLADKLKIAIDRRTGAGTTALVPMDGFHYDNAVLEERRLLARKGAPETFDVAGYAACLARVREGCGEVAVPLFDRRRDLARSAGALVEPHHRIVVTEGNYLLLDRPLWSDLAPLFDLTVFIDAPETLLEERLVRRWLYYGLTPEAARTKAELNDMPNARLVATRSRPADVVVEG